VDSLPKGFETLVEKSYKARPGQMLPYSFDEFLLPSGGWGEPSVSNDSTLFRLDLPAVVNNMATLEKLVGEARARGIEVVLLVTPQNPRYAKTGAYGVYGVRRSVAQELLERAKALDVLFLDENKMGNHDYKSSMAFNTDHLGREGAKQLSERLDSLFKTLE
jgi:hypothetical protein